MKEELIGIFVILGLLLGLTILLFYLYRREREQMKKLEEQTMYEEEDEL